MPVCDDKPGKKYILTHGKWTIMGSYDTPSKAKEVLTQLNNKWIEENIKTHCEGEINRFWPAFAERFHYTGWRGSVIAKLKTKREFRSAVTYEKENIIQIVPGKISNVFDVEHEVHALLAKQNILKINGYSYVKGGVLQQACGEIEEKPALGESNTCTLQTFTDLQKQNKLLLKNSLADSQSAATQAVQSNTLISASFLLTSLIEVAASVALLALTLLALPYLTIPVLLVAGTVATLTLYSGVRSLYSFFTKCTTNTSELPQSLCTPYCASSAIL
jgi:hypothetical protein